MTVSELVNKLMTMLANGEIDPDYPVVVGKNYMADWDTAYDVTVVGEDSPAVYIVVD